jgi:hypothetical protein
VSALGRLARSDERRDALSRVARRVSLPWVCAAALELGAGIHLELAFSHSGSNFGTASLLAAVAQMALGFAIAMRDRTVAFRLALVLELWLVQLYLVNVTLGLPPVIAHVHSGGTHEVFGLIFALPGSVDLEGVVAVASELGGAVAAGMLLVGRDRSRTS